MSYKYTSGSIRRGDIYYEDDRVGMPTYIDFGLDTITLRPSGSAILHVESTKVGINTLVPDYTLDVAGNIGISENIYHKGDDDTYMGFPGQNTINLVANGYSLLKYDGTILINSSSRDRDTQIKADNGNVVLHVDAGDNTVGIGTTSPTCALDIASTSIRVRNSSTPSSASDTGAQGEIRWDANYLYICVATDTWKRIPLDSW
tara:strand:+ start:5381 stop:5989 length:609 start_codon:yes stop_codon:yes gene_type:complete